MRERKAEREAIAQQKLVEAMERAATVFVEALEANASVVSRDGDVYEQIDHATRIRAADKLFDRTIGRPTQKLEHGGPDGEPIVVEHRLDVDRRRAVLEGLVDAGLIQPGDAGAPDSPPDPVHPA